MEKTFPYYVVEWAVKSLEPERRIWKRESRLFVTIDGAENRAKYIESHPRTERLPERATRVIAVLGEITPTSN